MKERCWKTIENQTSSILGNKSRYRPRICSPILYLLWESRNRLFSFAHFEGEWLKWVSSNVDKAQVSGTITVDALLGSQYQEMLERYPNIQIQYTTLTSYLYYYDDTGTKPFYMETITNGGNGRYWGSPSKTSTAQYSYSFIGWSKTQGGTVDPNARAAVVFDRNVYAAFKATVRKYMVHPDYNMPFVGWNPSPENIKGHTDCKAVFVSAYELAEISGSWEISLHILMMAPTEIDIRWVTIRHSMSIQRGCCRCRLLRLTRTPWQTVLERLLGASCRWN